ncbi:MAG: AIR carboxylase family protein [Elusimicrobiota bacterium]
MTKVVILMGSKSDMGHCESIQSVLESFGVKPVMRIASAHKSPDKVSEIIREYSGDTIFITVAGRSNALSGFVDAGTANPVIASPPYSEKYKGLDILSSLRMPSGVCPMTVLGPEQAALAAVKIMALKDSGLSSKIADYQKAAREKLELSDKELNK